MKHALVSIAAAATLLTGASMVRAQTADEVVEKHLAAVGGRAALSKVTSQVASGTISLSTQGVNIPGVIEISRKAPNKTRVLIKLDLSGFGGGEVIVDRRCDGKTAFESNSMQGDREVTGDLLQNLLNSSFPSPLMVYKEAGAKVELQGKDTVGGRAVLVLLYTPKAGPASKMFVDAETFLVTRTTTNLNLPEAGGAMEQTSEAADYRVVEGMKVPFSVTTITPVQTSAVSLTKIEINPPIDETIFARPAVK